MLTLPVVTAPKFELVVPSTKKTVQFRPYLVKEEKILFMAMESEEPKTVLTAMQDVVEACTFGKLDVSKLTHFDLEYIFIQLRIRSVGETVSVNLKCEKDGASTPVDIDLREVKVIIPKDYVPEKTIHITKTIGIVLRPMPISRFITLTTKDVATDLDTLTNMIVGSIDYVFDDKSVYKYEDVDINELRSFVDNLSHVNLLEVQNYLAAQPKVEHTVKFNCIVCGHENTVVLKGFQSFFA